MKFGDNAQRDELYYGTDFEKRDQKRKEWKERDAREGHERRKKREREQNQK